MQDFYCDKCDLIKKFQNNEIALEKARKCCANCKRDGERIYKFDIAVRAAKTNKAAATSNKPTGKKETYSKRYGKAVSNLQQQGKTVREIAETLGISPTSVVKIIKILKAPPTEKKISAAEELENQMFIDSE